MADKHAATYHPMPAHDDLVAYVAQTLTDRETEPPPGVTGRGDPYTDPDGCTYYPVYVAWPQRHITDIHDPTCERC